MIRLSALFTFLLVFFISNFLAAQTFFGVSQNPGDGTSQTAATITVAPPTSMVAGDLVVIYAHYRGTGITLTMPALGGQSWSTATSPAGAGTQTFAIFWCRFNGVWGGNPSIGGGSGTNALSAIMYVYRPSAGSSSWAINVTAVNSSATATTVPITGVTPTAAKTVTMAFWSSPAGNTWGTLSGAGWSNTGINAQYRNTAATGQQSHTAAYYIQATTANAVPNVSQTQSTSQSTRTSIISWNEIPLAPTNDACASAVSLTAGSSCTTSSGTLYGATVTNPTGSCGNMYDTWYKFTVPASHSYAKIDVDLTSSSSSLTNSNTFVELFNANACGSLNNNSMGCYDISSPFVSGVLIPGNTYYFRIYTSTNPNINPTNWSYDVCLTTSNNITGEGSRMNEVFKQEILSSPNVLNDPWEIAYGPDNNLWVTEAKGYKIYKIDPNSGAKTTVLDISPTGTGYLTAAEHTTYNREDWSAQTTKWPQGGLAGLALHPRFMAASNPKNYVYVSYVHDFDRTDAGNAGSFFRNWIVRFEYNTTTNKLEKPIKIIDTLPGSSDHNSQRMLIAPVGNTYYLFYAQGDMGAGQFDNGQRPNKAQITASYEGKILRFNLEPDASEGAYDAWIPNDNPFNNAPVGSNPPTSQSAVWVTGIRNNQGFAFATIKGVDYLYGSSHGPFSDDEINVLKRGKNYGHPRVIGYKADGNYNGAKAGEPGSILPQIYDEDKYATDTIGSLIYQDPIFSFYPAEKGDINTPSSIQFIYNDKTYTSPWVTGNALGKNANWYSEGISGMEIYTKSLIPGWKNSLILGTLKGGKIERMKLTDDGDDIVPAGSNVEKMDTLSYFRSKNRFRDVAIAPDGKTVYTIIDKSSSTSGPTQASPIQSACAGCLQKYTFLGYSVNTGSGNRSNIRDIIPIAQGKPNVFDTANKVVINAANGNNNIWVPITDTSSNIIAEINARGNDLDTIVTTFYTRTGASRVKNGKKYLNRNLTITPQKQPNPSTPVWIRLYITQSEFDQFVADGGIAAIGPLKIIKNEDYATTSIASNTTLVNTTVAEAFGTNNGYVLQGDITGFSSFYFAPNFITLPLQLINFRGSLKNEATLLQWETENEVNTDRFIVERSTNGQSFDPIGSVDALGKDHKSSYAFTDKEAKAQGSPILYYRLKMMDKDNEFKYSEVISVSLKSSTTVVVYPNPIDEEINLKVALEKADRIQITITDIQGHVVYKQIKSVSSGNNDLKINTKAWPSQTYTVQVSSSNKKLLMTKKVVKM